MENFVAYNPTKVHFGKGVVQTLGKTAKASGSKILLIYGKGSVVRNGIYAQVRQQLADAHLTVVEYSGIKANPVVEDANEVIKLGIENNVDVIVAIGGGSVIDTAKIASLAIEQKFDAWDVVTGKVEPTVNVPLIAVLTLAATGTEMNANAVIQNHKTKQKMGFRNILAYPLHSFLDPEYTYSVPREQTTNGIVDLIAHCFETYFGKGDAPLSDKFVVAIVDDIMKIATNVLDHPNDYEYRARMMWDSTCALNGMNEWGKSYSDWGTHSLGHVLSLLFDIAHGASLSIMYPAWLRLQSERIPERIAQLGQQLFGVTTPEQTIDEVEKFFKSISSPIRLSEIGISENQKGEIIENMKHNKCSGMLHQLNDEDYKKIVDFAF